MKKQILIVDDEADFTHLLKLSLESQGYYNVREENDPKRAIDAAHDFVPDLIVLDVMMPWRHGNDLAAQLHGDPRFSDIPVVFLTALACGDDACSETSDHGMGRHVYLPKGVPIEKLIECVEQLLARRRDRRNDRDRDRQMLMFKLANLRRNRQACAGAHRDGFNVLIEKVERALAELSVGDLMEAQ